MRRLVRGRRYPRLDLPQRKWISRVGIFQVEIVRPPRLGIAVLIAVGADREQRVGLVVHEVPPHLVGSVGQPLRVLVVCGGKQNHCGADRARAYGE